MGRGRNSAEISEGSENLRRTREELCGFLLLITRHWEIPLGQTADVTRAAREDYLAGRATGPVRVCERGCVCEEQDACVRGTLSVALFCASVYTCDFQRGKMSASVRNKNTKKS